MIKFLYSFCNKDHKSQSDTGKKLLYRGLNLLGVPSSDICIEKTDFGKPFFKDFPNIKFNISHSKNIVICVFSDLEIGCDIEEIRPCDLKLAKRFFSENEYLYLDSLPKEEQDDCFFRYWTLKESYIKAVGKGLSLPLNSFEINLSNELYLEKTTQEKKHWYFKELNSFEGFKCALCGLSPDIEEDFPIYPLTDEGLQDL